MRTRKMLFAGPLAASLVALAAVASAAEGARADGPKPVVKAEAKTSPSDRAREGIVVVERAGKAVGLGAVLGGDGRILAAKSTLGDGEKLVAKHADGTRVPLALGHSDATWDLALLVPQTGKRTSGVVASERADVAGAATRATFVPGKGHAVAGSLAVKGELALATPDGKPIDGALELGGVDAARALGAPILDADGAAVGLVVRGCVPAKSGPCKRAVVGAPVAAIRAFLATAPATAVAPAAWLGVTVLPDAVGFARGVRVQVPAQGGPADRAGLRGGAPREKADLIVAVEGTPVTSAAALAAEVAAHGVGERVWLLVFRDGKFSELPVVLEAQPAAAPASVAAPPPSAPAAPPAPLPGAATPPTSQAN